MKPNIIAVFVAIAQTLTWQAGAQPKKTNNVPVAQSVQSPLLRTWTFKQGGKIEAVFVSFQGTNQVIVRKTADAKNYVLTISLLSSDDQAYLTKLRETALKAQLDVEAKQLERAGNIELTKKLIENFPEKVDQKQGWMDAEFVEIDSTSIEIYFGSLYKNVSLGFTVKDKNGDHFSHCIAPKDKFSDLLTKLKQGDRIRVMGKIAGMGTSVHWVTVDSIKLRPPATQTIPQ